MEKYYFIKKNIIPFLKKLNYLLSISSNLSTNYKINLINILFNIFYINIFYYKNKNLSLKLCDKAFILYNELIVLESKLSIIDINIFIYENTINDISIRKINNDMFLYINLIKIIYNNVILENNILFYYKYIININKFLLKHFNKNNYDKLFNIINDIFIKENINLIEKFNMLINYLKKNLI